MVVAAVDLSAMGELVVERAFAFANEQKHAAVHLLHVVELLDVPVSSAVHPPGSSDPLKSLADLAIDKLRRVVRRDGDLGIREVHVHTALGAPATEIVDFAAHVDADYIFIATHGRRALARLLMGSVAELVVRRAGCPVMVVRDKKHQGDDEPKVEPPCPACVKRRNETKGAELWCEVHSQHHPRAHVYSYSGPSSDSARPWGFDR